MNTEVTAWRISVAAFCVALTLVWPLRAELNSQDRHDHEFAPLRDVKIGMTDFTFPTLEEGQSLNLREAVRGKKMVLLTYFAAWCHNSNFDVNTIKALHHKFGKKGLAVISVCEYSSKDELRAFIARHKPEYPTCLESDDQLTDRATTTHFKYRTEAGDRERKWGTPLTLIFRADELNDPSDSKSNGKPLINARAAFGEMIRNEAEDFIKQQLSDKKK
jgi:peroxiredoxin